jgi:tetratricopeptide (TPR) repeat protein
MKLENYYDRIDQYHAGELSTGDRQSFEQELGSNDELRQAEELYRLSLSALDYGVEESLRKDLKKWEQEGNRATGGGRIISFRRSIFILGAAAAVLLLVFFARPFLMPAPSGDELFASYYEAPDAPSMRGGSVPQNALTAAKKALAEESYADAVEDFARIPEGDLLYVEAQYYLGHALVGLKNYNAAKKAFAIAADSNESKFNEKGEWNYILASLKLAPMDAAIESKLKTIAQDEDSSFAKDAREILKKMK